MRAINYVHILKPLVEYLERQDVLLLDSDQMAAFLDDAKRSTYWLTPTESRPCEPRAGKVFSLERDRAFGMG